MTLISTSLIGDTFRRAARLCGFGHVPTPEERLAARIKYERMRASEAAQNRLAAYEERERLRELCAALYAEERCDGAEALDTEPTNEIPVEDDECPPTQRAGEMYPLTVPAFYALPSL